MTNTQIKHTAIIVGVASAIGLYAISHKKSDKPVLSFTKDNNLKIICAVAIFGAGVAILNVGWNPA